MANEVDRILAQYGQGAGAEAPARSWWERLGDGMRAKAAKPQSELWRDFGISALMAPLALRAGGHGTSYNHISEYLRMLNEPPPVLPPARLPSARPAEPPTARPQDPPSFYEMWSKQGKADGGEVSDVLGLYGQGFEPPQLNSGDGEVASTTDFLNQYGAGERMSSGVPGFLRRIGSSLRAFAPSQVTTPVNTLTGREPNLQARESHANPALLMAGEGADTMASWMLAHPGVDRGQSRPQDILAPLGLSAMAPLTAVNNAAGIFGGRLARTADREALSRAEEMAGRGVSRDDIWNQTGWFQGRDGQWRFEIDDSLAGLNPGMVRLAQDVPGVAVHGPTTREGMQHPALYAAYPEVAQSNFTLTNNPREPRGSGAFRDGPPQQVYVSAASPEIQRSVALHELQHAIQNQEGFARGSNLDAAASPVYEAINSQLSQLARQMDEAPTPAAKEVLRARYNELLDQRGSINARDLYHRTAGEVEARNVMARRDFSPEARRAVPPWRSQDVPDADQILARYGNGPQLSAETKGPQVALVPRPRMEGDLPHRFAYNIMADGKKLGSLTGHIDPASPDTAFISWMGASGRANELGPVAVRQIQQQFREMHPEVTRFTGDRVSGARRQAFRENPDQPINTRADVRTKGGDESPIGPTADEVLARYGQGTQMSAPSEPRLVQLRNGEEIQISMAPGERGQRHIEARRVSDNEPVAFADLSPAPDGTWTASSLVTNPGFRRQGAATALYEFADEMGLILRPEARPNKISDAARALWDNRRGGWGRAIYASPEELRRKP